MVPMLKTLFNKTEARGGSALSAAPAAPSWFAIRTRPRHEKKVARRLENANLTTFLPTLRQLHQWSDRQKLVELPLFSCYVFLQVADWHHAYLKVLHTPGVLQWIRLGSEPRAIPDSEIDRLRSLLSKDVPLEPYPYLGFGPRVRLRSGCLGGLEGILVWHKGHRNLVVSINLIRQSLAVSIEGCDFEGIP